MIARVRCRGKTLQGGSKPTCPSIPLSISGMSHRNGPSWSAWPCPIGPGSAAIRWRRCAAWPPRPGPPSSAACARSGRKSTPPPTSARARSQELQEQVLATDADVVIFDNDLSPGPGPQPGEGDQRQGTRSQRADPRHLRHAGPHRRGPACRWNWPSWNIRCPGCGKCGPTLAATGGGIGTARPRRNAARRRPPAGRSPHPRPEGPARRGAGPQGTRGSQPARGAHRLAGRLHQRRQEHAHERPDRRRRLVEDKLFSTLDTRTRQWHLKDWGRVLLSDTVGFIRDLPHHLVASFKATLEEARQARLLLHVVDAGNPQAEEQIKAVNKVLQELGCGDKPTLLVLNKIDRVTDLSYLQVLQAAPSASRGHQRRDGTGHGRPARRGHRDAQRRLRQRRRSRRTRATARCWPTWPLTPRSIARSSTTTASRSTAICRGTCCTTSRGRRWRCAFWKAK